MKAIKRYLTNRGFFAVVGLLIGFCVGEVGAMRIPISPKGESLVRQEIKGMQGQPAKTNAEKVRELKEASMSDNDYAVAQKTKTLKPGEYFVHANGTADGIVVKRDELEKSPVLKGMLEDTTWEQEHATIPLPFSADVIREVFNVLSSLSVNELVGVKASPSVKKLWSLDTLVNAVNNVYPSRDCYVAYDYLGLPNLFAYALEVIDRVLKIERAIQDIILSYRGFIGKVEDSSYVEMLKGQVFLPKYPEYEAFRKLNIEAGKIIKEIYLQKLETHRKQNKGFTHPHLVYAQIYDYNNGEEYSLFPLLPSAWTFSSEINKFESIGQYVCYLCDKVKELIASREKDRKSKSWW